MKYYGMMRFDDLTLAVGDGLERMEIVKEAGLTADGLSADLSAPIHRLFLSRNKGIEQHEEVTAMMTASNAHMRFDGTLDPVSGTLLPAKGFPEVNLSARSSMARLLDSKLKLTDVFIDVDASVVVSSVVKRLGFETRLIEPSGVKAGTVGPDGIHRLLLQGESPSDVVSRMVQATGFRVSIDGYNAFSFTKATFQQEPVTIRFGGENGQASSLQFADVDATSIQMQDLIEVPVGGSLMLVVEGLDTMSGRYYVTRARYELRLASELTEFDLSRTEPEAK